MKISIIDIGTKSLKHYIFDIHDTNKEQVFYKRYPEANLGESVVVDPETKERIFSILNKCLEINKAQDVETLKIVGTEIFRRSDSAKNLGRQIEDSTGFKIEIINQEKEAFYLYNGFVNLTAGKENFAAVNIGGGSTEIILGDNAQLKFSQGLPFGVNYLKSNFGDSQMDWPKLDKYLEENITSFAAEADSLYISGVLEFLYTVCPGLGINFRTSAIKNHPVYLTLDEYLSLVLKLRETPIEKLRSLFPQNPDFANNAAIGQSVYLKTAEKLGVKKVVPSGNDLADGLIREIKLQLLKPLN